MPEKERIIKTEYSELMQKSYIDYAMSVIVARALPDIRDGLKPVQRRTLYDMSELGIHSDKPYRKSARIVGDTMGKYHPHGDSSIYDCLVVMAQDFKKEIPLVDGHGNFGNIEGDGAAAMRYTEAKTPEVYGGSAPCGPGQGCRGFCSEF
jgi:DNA gyrase subunit A